jgi:hypothetical protein
MYIRAGHINFHCHEDALKPLLEAASKARIPAAVRGAVVLGYAAGNSNLGEICDGGERSQGLSFLKVP